LLEEQQHDAAFLAHMSLCRVPGAGAWLTAPPAEDGREVDAPLFKVALKRRLRAPVYDEDGFCPCCGGVLDRWGDHALVCPCGGDRTIRHNSLRDIVFEEALEGGVRPEREKAGLLPQRPTADGLPVSPLSGNGRRPADVWLPRGPNGGGEALDFAVTSGMRADIFRQAAQTPELVFSHYAKHKREYLQTAKSCEEAGFRFVPVILEAHGGGWGSMARGVLDWVSRQVAAVQQEEVHVVSLRIAQRISCTLHRENARAVLKRSTAVDPSAQPHPSGWEAPSVDAWQ
jgi:hypothetical protein